MITIKPIVEEDQSLTSEDADYSSNIQNNFKKLFIEDEAKFLLACLATGFDPSFIVVCQSNLEAALAYKSISRTKDFLGAATSTPQAIDLLRNTKPGFLFIHERTEESRYTGLAQYVTRLPSHIKIFILTDYLEVVKTYTLKDVDVFIADCDLYLPVNPLAQGLMAMIAGTLYRSPSVTSYLNELSSPVDQLSSRHISLNLREQQLLEAYVLGLSNREVAESLNLSVRTVQTYSGQLLARLGVNNRQKALLRVAQLGISVIPKFFRGNHR